MSGGKVVAWLDEIGGSWETEGQASRFSDGPPRALVLQSDLDAAIARAEAAERDAARYRWLREHFRFTNDSLHEIWFDASLEPDDSGVPSDLDQELDAAIAAQQAEGEA